MVNLINISKITESIVSREDCGYENLVNHVMFVYAEIVDFLREHIYFYEIYNLIIQTYPQLDKNGNLFYKIKLKRAKEKPIKILIKFYLFNYYVLKYEYIDKHCGIHECTTDSSVMLMSLIKKAYERIIKIEEDWRV